MFEDLDNRFDFETMAGNLRSWKNRLRNEDRRDPRKQDIFEMRRGSGHDRRGESHGSFEPGRHGDPREPFGPGRPGGSQRFFGRGDVKFALLELLVERPMHGYEMMKALEEKSGGFYVPSAGTIYPTLQMLEDRGFVTSSHDSGKRIYQITEAGRAQLAERQTEEVDLEMISRLRGFVSGENNRWNTPEMHEIRTASAHLWHRLMHATRKAVDEPEQLARLQSLIEQWSQDLTEVIHQSKVEGEEPPA
jgi:DNA-binding PadR family transcriptional regulator